MLPETASLSFGRAGHFDGQIKDPGKDSKLECGTKTIRDGYLTLVGTSLD